ncbi:Olfactory Receptor 7E24 [Manis pentadactyla]|nr:Olfactory Receptor 7E24 [Manis pentadactyla]
MIGGKADGMEMRIIKEFGNTFARIEDPQLQPLFFGLFLSMYLVTVLANRLIILAVGSDPHLHNPMYSFLSSLSLDDTGFSSATIPEMLVNIQTHSKSISYAG